MTRIICAEDCGNSPRKLLLKKLLTALAKGENAFVLKNLSEDILWDRVGAAPLRGKESVATMLEELKRQPRSELVIENIVTHGPTGAANGTLKLANGRTYAFSHVYRFRGAADAHIRVLTEYLIKT
jgi:hypothetical protein